jgi:hypothetical protein
MKKLALAFAGALFLTAATPAFACPHEDGGEAKTAEKAKDKDADKAKDTAKTQDKAKAKDTAKKNDTAKAPAKEKV